MARGAGAHAAPVGCPPPECCDGGGWGDEPPSDGPDYPPIDWPPGGGGEPVGECVAPCFESSGTHGPEQYFRYKPRPCAEPDTYLCVKCCCGCNSVEEWRERSYVYIAAGYSGGDLIWSETERVDLARITCVCVTEDDVLVRHCTTTYRSRVRERSWNSPTWTEWDSQEVEVVPDEYRDCIPGERLTAWPWSTAACDEWVSSHTDRVECHARRRVYRRDTGLDEFGGHRIDHIDLWATISSADPCAGPMYLGECPETLAALSPLDFLPGGAGGGVDA